MMWVDVCAKYIGRRYDARFFNCRHLAAAVVTDLTGFDANSIFGTGENESKLKLLPSNGFKRVKVAPIGLCLLILKDRQGLTHVAVKHNMEVLHNLGAYSFGQVCLSRWETIRDEYKDISFWVLEYPKKETN